MSGARVQIIKNYAFSPFSLFACRTGTCRSLHSVPNRERSLLFCLFGATCVCLVVNTHAHARTHTHSARVVLFATNFHNFRCCCCCRLLWPSCNSSLLILFNVKLSTYFCVNNSVDSLRFFFLLSFVRREFGWRCVFMVVDPKLSMDFSCLYFEGI